MLAVSLSYGVTFETPRKDYLSTFLGFYESEDAGLKDEDGYVYIVARPDDIINVAGHRLSTGATEDVFRGHPDIAECAAIGIGDTLTGQSPAGLVCLNAGADRTEDDIQTEWVTRIRKEIGPVAALEQCIVIDAPPKARSGKILRGTLVAIADSTSWNMPATIDDRAVFDAIADPIAGLGQPTHRASQRRNIP